MHAQVGALYSGADHRPVHRAAEVRRDEPATVRPGETQIVGFLVLPGTTIEHLAQVIDELGKWHNRTKDGRHDDGEDGEDCDDTVSAREAADELTTAANTLRLASSHLHRAHGRNGVVRWYQEPQES